MKRQAIYIKRNLLFFTIIATMFTAQPILAQDGFDDDVDDEPAVPIDGSYLLIGLIAGAYFGIRFLNKQAKA